jgi:hypothetical protein
LLFFARVPVSGSVVVLLPYDAWDGVCVRLPLLCNARVRRCRRHRGATLPRSLYPPRRADEKDGRNGAKAAYAGGEGAARVANAGGSLLGRLRRAFHLLSSLAAGGARWTAGRSHHVTCAC